MLINKIYEEVKRCPWWTISQVAFALNTTPASVTGTCSAAGTTFNKIKTSEIRRLKEYEVNSKMLRNIKM
jgi:soluble P-type ATPase